MSRFVLHKKLSSRFQVKPAFMSVCLALLLAAPVISQAQESGEQGVTVPETPDFPIVYKFDTRTIGMADATIADAAHLSSININPAGLSFLKTARTVQVNLFHNWDNNLAWQNITFPVFAYQRHTVAAQIGHHHAGLNTFNILSGSSSNQPDFNMYQFDLAYAWSILDVLSIGVLQNVSFAANRHSHYWSSLSSIGLLYAPSQSISYGVAFRGIGRSPAWSVIPDGRTAITSQRVRKSLELGATLHFPVDTDRTWLSLSLANEKRFGESGIWYKGGLEVYVLPYLALRSGVIFNLDGLPDEGHNIVAPRFGFGFHKNFITIDYALSPSGQLPDRFHQIGITVDF